MHFNAAHKLYNPSWSDERNLEIFGKCANENWHGHNFDIYITVKGRVNPETGYVIDMKVLKDLIQEKVISKLDHRNINLDVDFMQGKLASIENLAMAIWNELFPHINAGQLYCVKIYETPRQYVTYYGN